MRLEARPVRTDMPVTDTGTVKAEATMQRAELLRDAPMKATVTWDAYSWAILRGCCMAGTAAGEGTGYERADDRHACGAALHNRLPAARLPPLRYFQRGQ